MLYKTQSDFIQLEEKILSGCRYNKAINCIDEIILKRYHYNNINFVKTWSICVGTCIRLVPTPVYIFYRFLLVIVFVQHSGFNVNTKRWLPRSWVSFKILIDEPSFIKPHWPITSLMYFDQSIWTERNIMLHVNSNDVFDIILYFIYWIS